MIHNSLLMPSHFSPHHIYKDILDDIQQQQFILSFFPYLYNT